ncbi:MAG: archaemetzincin family Zn-dependent metalloprotease [Thermoproteales archaeon]|nr:archaemetzincin family Zn-dependent metalloprotease [Thermoproteales archaeon]
MRHKYLIQIYSTGVEDRILEDLIQSLKTTFNAKLSLNYLEWKDIVQFYNPMRKQVNASKLIYWLSENISFPPNSRMLVLANIDGYVEGLNFVFGISNPGIGGIVFTTRLNPLFYGEEYDDYLYRLRIFKETLHELGHSYGLTHCQNLCVMRFSNSIYDVDRKPAHYCTKCQKKLNYHNPELLKT